MYRLPPLVFLLGYAGLLPFIAGPLWLSLVPDSAPVWLDRVWLLYAAMIASFMAGSLWGMALPTAEGPDGLIGMALATVLMLLAWGAAALAFPLALLALAAVFILLVLAEIWRQRVLDPLSGYFSLRLSLTAGVVLCLGWRYALL
ncbi:MAG: DUF3429 domain-containing protein [Nevskia sp.]|nr:DUF3429 domain-containing protein [Nevskia sp.]